MHLSSLSSLFVALLLVVFLPSQQPTEARSLNNQADQQELISIISGLTDQALSRSSHVDSSPASVSSSSSASSYDDNNSNNNEDVVKDESALSENEEQSAISLMVYITILTVPITKLYLYTNFYSLTNRTKSSY